MDLSVVVVTYNSREHILECLRSLAPAAADATMECVVVDNASKENAVPFLQVEFPWADAVRSEVNGGWAGGNNLGVQHAMARGAEWIVLLNNDTTVPPRFVRRLMEAAEAHPEYGVLGPVIDDPTAYGRVISTVGVFIAAAAGRTRTACLIPIATACFGLCPLYLPFHFDTTAVDRPHNHT